MSIRRTCAICPAKEDSLCHILPKEMLSRLSRVAHHRRYSAGQFIMGAGQQQDWFGTVLSGVVKLTKTMVDGRQQIVGLLFASDFLGRPFGADSPYAAEAATAAELCCFDRAYFEDLMRGCPELKQLFLERTLNEVDAARDWMLLLGRKSAEEKVASLILLMAKRMAREMDAEATASPPVHFALPLSRTEMAEYLGLRIETVSRQIRRLRASGVIQAENGRTIVVRDVCKLAEMAE